MHVAEQAGICFGQPNLKESAKSDTARIVEKILCNLKQ
jgi:hypothetical protein